MDLRKTYVNGRRIAIEKLHAMPRLSPGVRLFVVVALAGILWLTAGAAAAGVSLGIVPGFSLNKEGATGDNLALLNDIEKRLSVLPEDFRTKVLAGLVEKELEERIGDVKGFKGMNAEDVKKFLGDGPEGFRTILKAQGEIINQLKAEAAKKEEDFSIRTQIEKWRGENKEAIEKIGRNQKAELTALQIRVASPMTPANTLNSATAANNAFISTFERAPGIVDLIRVRPTLWDFLRKGRTSSKTYIWVNKKNPLGDAAFIAPGVAKPGISFELKAETSVAKKIAESLKTATELLTDVEGMQSFINDELAYVVRKKVNSHVTGTGAGDADTIKGLNAFGALYTLAGVQTDNPNNWDAIRAAVAQLRVGNFEGEIVASVNPVDKANMDLTKAISQGQLFIPSPPQATIIEDNNMPVGYVSVSILDFYKILMYQDFTVTFGFENDDFTKNLVTVVGEMKMHQYVSDNHAGFVVYDTFANIKAAIAAA